MITIASSNVFADAPGWSLATNAAPWAARGLSGLVQYNGKTWILGGCLGPGSLANDVWYSSDMLSWTIATNTAPWSQRDALMSVVYDDKMWVMGGGYVGTYAAYNDVWFSSDGANWTLATGAAAWSARQVSGLVTFNGKMWLLGGVASEGVWVYKNDVWSSTNGVDWTLVTNAAPWSVRSCASCFVFDGKIWILGGWNGSVATNDVWYSADGTNWVQATSAAPWEPRFCFPPVVHDGEMWVLGGQTDSAYTNDVWHSSDGVNWSQALNAAPWSPRRGHSVATVGETMWLLGGEISPYSFLNDVWFSHPAQPAITSGPTVTNALLHIRDLWIVAAGETNAFAVSATDPGGNPLDYQWSFGDGSTNAWSALSTATHAYTSTNCGGLYTASVTVTNGTLSTSSNLTVMVACPLKLTKLQGKLNFAKTNADSCTVKGTFDLPANYSFAGKLVTLDIGDAPVSFSLGRKGSGVNGLNVFKKPTYNKKTGLWTFSATLKNSSWQSSWAEYGMINSDIPKPGVLVTNFPVVVVLDTEAFMGTVNLHYTAKQGKSGTAK
jgi:hypothetical protein